MEIHVATGPACICYNKNMTKRVLGLFLVLTISLHFSIPTFAEEISEQKLSNIETNCASIKESLKRTQNADKNTRISLGRTYQTLLSDFITPLNVRLVKNNRFDAKLADSQSTFSADRDVFNQTYISYSQEFEALLSIDCQSEPQRFYEQLEKTREARNEASTAAIVLANDVSDHAKAIEDYKIWLKENMNE